MKANELREKSADELKQELLGLLKEQFNLRMQKDYWSAGAESPAGPGSSRHCSC